MATPQELLQKLEDRFILGEISEATFKELKASLLARFGGVVINAGQSKAGIPSETGLVVCPLCGRSNKPEKTFRCRRCETANLCLMHMREYDEYGVCCDDPIVQENPSRLSPEDLERYNRAVRMRKYYRQNRVD